MANNGDKNKKDKELHSREENKKFLNNIKSLIEAQKIRMDLKEAYPLVLNNNLYALLNPEEFIKVLVPNKKEEIDTIEIYFDTEHINLDEILPLLDSINNIYKGTAKALGIDPLYNPLIITKLEKGSLLAWLRGKKQVIIVAIPIICAVISTSLDSANFIEDHFDKKAPVTECALPNEVFLEGKYLSQNLNMEYECITKDKKIRFKISSKQESKENLYKTYTVKENDTLSSIALINDIDLNSLLAMNNLRMNDTIYPGQKLKVLTSYQTEFKDFLMKKYRISESSARDYVGRFNGILARGIYKGENEITPRMEAAVEKEYPNSKEHYLLTLKRYIEFKQERDK
jgi:LysM repeat protein